MPGTDRAGREGFRAIVEGVGMWAEPIGDYGVPITMTGMFCFSRVPMLP